LPLTSYPSEIVTPLDELLFRDATDQLKALSAREVTARELLQIVVAQTDRTRLNAVVARDLDRAYADAERTDRSRTTRTNAYRIGRLGGLPMTVKDTLDVEGMPASAGIRSMLDRSAQDAIVVRRARTEGAIVWGKTNTPLKAGDWQTYNPLYGTTDNPWKAGLTPGGSSGGSAVAIAAGLSALEIGADIGGSLRVPASFCGVFAHKPTYGLVSQTGLVPPENRAADLDLAVVGPLARSARDLRLLLSIFVGKPISSKPVDLTGVRVALWLDEPTFPLDGEVRTALEGFADRLVSLGTHVKPVKSPIPTEALMSTYTMLLYSLIYADLDPAARVLYEGLRAPAKLALALGAKPLSWAQGVVGATARHREWLIANEARARMQEALNSFFSRYDVLLTPVSPTVAFPHDHRPIPLRKLHLSNGRSISYLEMMNWIALATVAGLPATVMPAARTARNLPVGVQIIGKKGADAKTLAVAQAIEQRLGGFHAPPSCLQAGEHGP
jgi:amidase